MGVRSGIDRYLADLFTDHYEVVRDVFSVYRRLYDLPTVTYEGSNLSEEAFEYCKQRGFFVVVVPYTTDGTVFLSRSFYERTVGWLLPGGSIRLDQHELIQDAVLRQFRRAIFTGADPEELTQLGLGELDPIAYIVNTFTRYGESVEHRGLGFVGRIRCSPSLLQRYKSDILVEGSFVKTEHGVELSQYSNDEVFKYGKRRIATIDFRSVPEAEIAEKPPPYRLAIHRRCVKPAVTALSRFLGRDAVNRVNESICELVSEVRPSTFLDASCGDNRLVLEIARKVPICAANDIAYELVRDLWYKRKTLKPPLPRDHVILPTNHDITMLPFRDGAFDAALCKNTLHHMGGVTRLHALLESLRRVTAKRIVLVEIMDPKYEPLWARLRHRYYMGFLKEGLGQAFFSKTDFETVIGSIFGDHAVCFSELRTIRGVYLFAVVDLN